MATISYYSKRGTLESEETYVRLEKGYRVTFDVHPSNAIIEVDGVQSSAEFVRELGSGFSWRVSAPGYITQEGTVLKDFTYSKLLIPVYLDEAGVLNLTTSSYYPTIDMPSPLIAKMDGQYLKYNEVSWTSSSSSVRIVPYSDVYADKVVIESGKEEYYALALAEGTNEAKVTAAYSGSTASVTLYPNALRLMATSSDGTLLGSNFDVKTGDYVTLQLYYGDSEEPLTPENGKFYHIAWSPGNYRPEYLWTPLTLTGATLYSKELDSATDNWYGKMSFGATATYTTAGGTLMALATGNFIENESGDTIMVRGIEPIHAGESAVLKLYKYNLFEMRYPDRAPRGIPQPRKAYFKYASAPKTGYYRKAANNSYIYCGEEAGEGLVYFEKSAINANMYTFYMEGEGTYEFNEITYNLGDYLYTDLKYGASASNDGAYIVDDDGAKVYAEGNDGVTYIVLYTVPESPNDTVSDTYVSNGRVWQLKVHLIWQNGRPAKKDGSWSETKYCYLYESATTVTSAETQEEALAIAEQRVHEGTMADGDVIYVLSEDMFYGVRVSGGSVSILPVPGRLNIVDRFPWGINSAYDPILRGKVLEGESGIFHISNGGSPRISQYTTIVPGGSNSVYLDYSEDKVNWNGITAFDTDYSVGDYATVRVAKANTDATINPGGIDISITGLTGGTFYLRVYGGYQKMEDAYICEMEIIEMEQLKDYHWFIEDTPGLEKWDNPSGKYTSLSRNSETGDFTVTANSDIGAEFIKFYSRGLNTGNARIDVIE